MKAKVYKVYGLIDPRNDVICYIGCTRVKLKARLSQHNNPIENNKSKIAKLSRFLKLRDLKFSIVELFRFNNEDDMFNKEIECIKCYKEQGYKLYNIQAGGKLTINEAESYRKAQKSLSKKQYVVTKGENANNAKLTESEAIEIFELIKQGCNNSEIHELFSDRVKLSAIKAMRSGQNWKELYDKILNGITIPSIKKEENGYQSLEKIEILHLIHYGLSDLEIHQLFKKISKSDIKRIRNRKIWKPVWQVYDLIAPLRGNS